MCKYKFCYRVYVYIHTKVEDRRLNNSNTCSSHLLNCFNACFLHLLFTFLMAHLACANLVDPVAPSLGGGMNEEEDNNNLCT